MTNVCFIGHSKIENICDVKNNVKTIVEELVSNGSKNFFFGGRGMFDHICWEVVTELKKQNNSIQRYYCYESSHDARKAPKWLDKNDYDECVLLNFFDKSYKTIFFRNCAMIDACDLCVFYAEERISSGAYKALFYAKKKNKTHMNLI